MAKPLEFPGPVLVLSNVELGDTTFDSDVGSWNVTRAQRDCAAGKHKRYLFDTPEVMRFNLNIEVEPDKIAAMAADKERLINSPPLIFAVENSRLWLIDGHHRLRAMAQVGIDSFSAFVIEEQDGARYRVFYNGKRVAPWMSE